MLATISNDQELRARIDCDVGVFAIFDLRDLRTLLDASAVSNSEDARCIGLLVALFASANVMRPLMEFSRSNIMKILDGYYFVVTSPALDRALQAGIEEGLDVASKLYREQKLDELPAQIDERLKERG